MRYAHLAATAINMRTGGGKCAFVGLSECRGPTLYCISLPLYYRLQRYVTFHVSLFFAPAKCVLLYATNSLHRIAP